MFPEKLDNANVLYFTDKGCYDTIRYTDGRIYDYIFYLAICTYDNDDGFYLFGCNANKEVISDYLCNTIEECMNIYQNIEWRSAK